jgi:hypothetical protein
MWCTAGKEEDAVYCGKELDVEYCRGRGRCCVLWERVGCGVLPGKRKMLCTVGKSWMWSTGGEEEDAVYSREKVACVCTAGAEQVWCSAEKCKKWCKAEGEHMKLSQNVMLEE